MKEDYSKKTCSKCKKSDNIATIYCQNCKDYLCKPCFDAHKTWADLKHHIIVTIEDLSTGKASFSQIENQFCDNHEGEQKKFYCKTCQKLVCRDCIVMKQHCRDHDYVTLKDAAAEKLSALQQEMKECQDKKKECQDAIQQTQSVTTELESAVENAKRVYQLAKADYMKQVEHFFAEKVKDVEKLQMARKGELSKTDRGFQDKLQQVESALKKGTSVAESGSHYNIIANSQSVLETLKQVNQINLSEVDAKLSEIPVSISMGEFNQPWKQVGGFNVDCKEYPTGIAVTSDGKVAVCDRNLCVKVLSKSGNLLHTFDGMLGGLGDVCITSNDVYFIPKCLYENPHVIECNSNYKLLSEFKTVNAGKKPCAAGAVAVDKNKFMIFGMIDNAISIHNADGSLKSTYTIPYMPYSVAVTSNKEVVVVAPYNGKVQLFDYSGQCLHTLTPPPDVTKWEPRYVCCSTTDEVFVVNKGTPKAIYKYTAGRVYMGCVTTEVNNPSGVALSHDDQTLYVTDSYKMVKMFRRP